MELCFRPRRSALYVPGCNQHYLNRARSLPADAVILDLGDPILVASKIESPHQQVMCGHDPDNAGCSQAHIAQNDEGENIAP